MKKIVDIFDGTYCKDGLRTAVWLTRLCYAFIVHWSNTLRSQFSSFFGIFFSYTFTLCPFDNLHFTSIELQVSIIWQIAKLLDIIELVQIIEIFLFKNTFLRIIHKCENGFMKRTHCDTCALTEKAASFFGIFVPYTILWWLVGKHAA